VRTAYLSCTGIDVRLSLIIVAVVEILVAYVIHIVDELVDYTFRFCAGRLACHGLECATHLGRGHFILDAHMRCLVHGQRSHMAYVWLFTLRALDIVVQVVAAVPHAPAHEQHRTHHAFVDRELPYLFLNKTSVSNCV